MWVKFITPCMILILARPRSRKVAGCHSRKLPIHGSFTVMHYYFRKKSTQNWSPIHLLLLLVPPIKWWGVPFLVENMTPCNNFNQPTNQPIPVQGAHPFPVVGRFQKWVHPFWKWSSDVRRQWVGPVASQKTTDGGGVYREVKVFLGERRSWFWGGRLR